ncbi:MAG: toprim domain-containing protein, partial [Halobacteriota archaeon]|nr:toprim domain-containing protein [Halobacteriota archaeon]
MEYIITEKHNTAKRIASILSGGDLKNRKIGGIDAYEFDGRVVIGLSGHIVGADFPEKYRNWSDVDPGELIDSEIITVPTQKKFITALKKIAKEADHVTIATDYDREGEFIGVEALRIIIEVNPKIDVDRVKYSAITPSEIISAFDEPTDVDYNLAAASETRQIVDLIWGSVLTRYVSLSAG